MSALTLESAIKLPSGASMPRLGFGVYQARGTECGEAVKTAIKAGYRHSRSPYFLYSQYIADFETVDSAQVYRNEDIVGTSVVDSKIPRSQMFLTTKYMPTHKAHPSSNVLKDLRKSLDKIDKVSSKSDKYIDLVLIHAPWGGEKGREENWKALADAQKEGWVKDIGVSNL
jgi:diketogulonate reductase-like aldo/keto reductase